MNLIIEKYELTIKDNSDNSRSIKLELGFGEGKALLKERRKIYLIESEGEMIYVGEAHTSIETRLKRGLASYNFYILNNRPRNGYKGYKWFDVKYNEIKILNVYVAIFNDEYDDYRDFVESVEGELAYLIRSKTGNWPKCQNEIHFRNENGAKEVAENIFKSFLE